MRVAGFSITASDVRIVTLEGTREDHERIAEQLHKVSVGDGSSATHLKAVVGALNAHIRDTGIERVGLVAYAEGGKYGAGASVFRIEGGLMVSAEAALRFIHKATIGATERRLGEQKRRRPTTKALGLAYDLAFECLD